MELAVKTANAENTAPENRPQSNRKAHLLALLFFVVITFWLTWPVLPNAGRSLEQWGDALLQTWTLDWDAHALATNPLHLFQSNTFYPYQNTLAFSESLIGQAFLVTPLIWLTNNSVLGYNVLLLLSFILSGWGVYLLVVELTGSKAAGLVSGVIFAFFPNRFTQFSHLHLLGTEWMPFCLLYLRRFLQNNRWRNGLAAAFFLAMELLSSTYLGLFTVVCVLLYVLFIGTANLLGKKFKVRLPKKFSLRQLTKNPIVRLAIVMILAGLVVLPFLKPYLDVQRDLGFDRSQAEVENWSAAPNYYLDLFKFNRLNEIFLNPVLKSVRLWEVGGGERQLYLGTTAMLLGLVGLVVIWKKRKTERDGLYYVLLGLVAFAFTFGPVWHTGRFGDLPLPYWLLYNFLPGFQALRVPVRFIYVVALALSVIAGFGMAAIIPRLRLKLLWPVLATGLVGGLIVWVFGNTLWIAAICGLVIGGAAFGLSKISLLKLTPLKYAQILVVTTIIGLLCFEYATDVSIKDSNLLHEPPPASQWLADHPGVVLNVPLSGTDYTDMFYMYWSRLGWQPVMNGSSGFMPPAYDALRTAWQQEFPSARIITLLQGLEVRYLVIDSSNPEIQPTWAKTQKAMAQFSQLKVAAQFGSVYIYELQANPWLRDLAKIIKPTDPVYFVEYKRNQPQLLELAAYFMESAGVSQQGSLYGNISIADRALPTLSNGTPAAFALIQAGEDPTLYGFRLQDKKWSNALVDFYQKSSDLISRYDFSRSNAFNTLNRNAPLTFGVSKDKLTFGQNVSASTWAAAANDNGFNLRLGLASLTSQNLTLTIGDKSFKIALQPGLSFYQTQSFGIDNLANVTIKNENGQSFSLVSAELWRDANNQPVTSPSLQLRQDVVLIQATAQRDNQNGIASLNVIAPGDSASKYTGTLDVYARPFGSNPQGHYGYWSVALNGGTSRDLQFNLNLPTKLMQTQLNGGSIPNYPPNPQDLDITQYAKIGDFRASFNLFTTDKFVGSVKLFDFAVEGDKSNAAKRYVTDFSNYDTAITYLVINK